MLTALRAGALALLIAIPAFADTPVTMRARIEVNSAAITLGDVFDGAGDVAARPIAPAPAPGQVANLSTEFVQTAAQSAGLAWTPPAGLTAVQVSRPAATRAAPASSAPGIAVTRPVATAPRATGAASAPVSATTLAADAPGVRRGETILLTYATPGLTLSTRARAMSDGGVGEPIRVTNTASNRVIEAVVTGPGAATTSVR